MILELVGLPGSGKSTFAKRLAEEGGWQIVRTNGIIDILWNNLCFLVRHPIYFSRGLIAILRFRGDRSLWYTKFLNLFLVHNAKYMKASRLPRAIIDQGHHQNVVSLFDREEGDAVIRTFLAGLPRPDVLLFFVVEEEERARRLRARGYGARENIAGAYKEVWENAREKNFEMLYALREEIPATTILVAPGTEEAARETLRRFRLWRFVMHLRMPTEKAHGLQIANTLQALSRVGEHVELWVSRRSNKIGEDIFSYYGLRERFPVRYLPVVPVLRLVSLIGPFAYWFEAAFFLLTLLVERIDTGAIYYTRNAEVAWLLALKGASVYYEAHLWPSTKVRAFKFFLRRVKGVVANSNGTAEVFQTQGFSHVAVIRNGVDLDKFAIDVSEADARKEVELPPRGEVIMYVGSFARWKGVATLYAAWTQIRDRFPQAFLVMVGGTIEELSRFPECEDADDDARCIVRGHLPSRLIPTYLRAADVLLLPNEPVTEEAIRFTSPIKLFEYMASGKPIIASGLPSMREVLNETNATLFTPGDVNDLAEKIAFQLLHKEEGRWRAEKAGALARQYSWEARAKRLVKFISEES